jgi:transcription initiation factor TFIID TATA-box-binding protein
VKDASARQRLLHRLNIVNVVATSELKQFVDLGRLVPLSGFLYDQTIYRCAYLKDGKTKAKVSIFSSGKMICAGAKSYDDAKHDLKHAAKRLAELGLIEPTRIVVKLQNIVATGGLGRLVDIERLATKLPNVIYEPEQFPGAIYYAKELEGASILIFASGKVVFAGLRSPQMLERGRGVLEQLAQRV